MARRIVRPKGMAKRNRSRRTCRGIDLRSQRDIDAPLGIVR